MPSTGGPEHPPEHLPRQRTSTIGREDELRELTGLLVARGLTNHSIAGQLFLSVRTADTHVDRVLTKLGFSNRSQLVAWAYESGLATGDGE
jgi:DNA-binding NarL/FixJ family response regulator